MTKIIKKNIASKFSPLCMIGVWVVSNITQNRIPTIQSDGNGNPRLMNSTITLSGFYNKEAYTSKKQARMDTRSITVPQDKVDEVFASGDEGVLAYVLTAEEFEGATTEEV
jgi:hypothetical protein